MGIPWTRPARSLAGLSCAAIAALAAPAIAQAEIYGWVDGNGTFTYSNLPPPDSARVTDVIPEDPAPSPKARADAARLADLAALNDRIRLLELEQAREQRELAAAAQAAAYMPPAPSYPSGCGPDGTFDCASYGAPVYYLGGGWPVYFYRGGVHYGGHYGGYNRPITGGSPLLRGHVAAARASGAARGASAHR